MHTIFLLLLLCAVRVSGFVSDADRCSGPDAFTRLWSLTRAFEDNRSNFHLLEDDGCLGQEELDEIEKDPEDAAEYLGDEHEYLGDEHGRNLISPSLCMWLKRPNAFYIGVGHSGSTTLARHLETHPLISYGLSKEHSFWKMSRYRQSTSFTQYLLQFPVPCMTRAVIDFNPWVYEQAIRPIDDACDQGPWAQRGQPPTPLGESFVRKFKELMGPSMKLIMMIRDPYDLLHSGQINGTEVLYNLSNGLALDDRVICRWHRSRYAEALEQWLNVYPRENFLFLRSEDFFRNPQGTLSRTFRFLGVDDRTYTPSELASYSGRRRAAQKEFITERMRHEFHQHPLVRRDREKLQELTGLHFDWDPLSES